MDIRKVIPKLSFRQIPAPVWYLAAVLVVMTGVVFTLQSSQSLEGAKTIIRLNMDDVEATAQEYGNARNTIRLDSDAQAIAKAHAFAYMIELRPSIVGDEKELERIRKLLDVDELHVSDKNGILVGSTIGSYIGYDMTSAAQSKAFMLAIYYKDFELAQKPQPKGADRILFQYAGVARLDQPGIVQIGYKPQRLLGVMQTADISRVAKEWRIGATGEVMIADFDGKILSTIDGRHLGESLVEYGFPEKAFNGPEGEFTVRVRGESNFIMYRFFDRSMIIASIPLTEIYGERNKTFIIMLLISVAALGGALFIAARRTEPDTASVPVPQKEKP